MTGPSSDPSTSPNGKAALLVVLLIVFLDLLGFGIIIPLLPFYVPGYEGNPLKVTLLFSIYSMCQFIGSPVLGAMSDRFGRKPVLVVSQLGSACGYLLLALATQIDWGSATTVLAIVYFSRIIDGFTGGNISTAQAYISDITPKDKRSAAMGMLGAAFGVGFALGPAMGGLLGHINVSLPAYVAAGLSAGAGILSAIVLKESRVHKADPAEAWLHPSRFLPVLRKPVVAHLLGASFLSMAAFVMMEATASIFLHKTFGYGEREVGLFFAYVGVVIVVVQGGLIGRITKKYGEWVPAVLGNGFVAIGLALYCVVAYHPALTLLLVAGAFNAAGRSLFGPTVSSLLSSSTDPDKQGITFGLYHGLMSLSRVFGPIVAGLSYPLLRHSGAFAVASVMCLGAMIWMWGIHSLAKRTAAEATGFPVVPANPQAS